MNDLNSNSEKAKLRNIEKLMYQDHVLIASKKT